MIHIFFLVSILFSVTKSPFFKVEKGNDAHILCCSFEQYLGQRVTVFLLVLGQCRLPYGLVYEPSKNAESPL